MATAHAHRGARAGRTEGDIREGIRGGEQGRCPRSRTAASAGGSAVTGERIAGVANAGGVRSARPAQGKSPDVNDLRQQLQTALGSAYTLERELGGGGMSRTYLATEHALSRRVVIKVLAPELLAGISVERFKREVLLAAGLQHPHVVPVLSAGDADGLPWFTMPFVEGESLRLRLAKGPLSIGEVTGLLRDVARALEFAHERGVVHRDIKPDNVLLAGSSATVTDFGIAKAISAARAAAPGATLTAVGTAIGTPAYMPPEQAAGDPNVDHRSDIYAFGAMAYELLAGRPPFVADSPARVISAHFNEVPRDVRELRGDTPPALAELVQRCLAKEVGDRPQEARELVRVLDNVTASGPSSVAAAALRAPQLQLGRALALWAGSTAVVAVTAWAATRTIGLPDWALPGALGVMLAGLPAVLGTWYVQRATRRALTGTPTFTPGGSSAPHGALATMAIKASPHLSWRRTWLGGALAVGGFATLVVAFMVMRALGIGPMGSLMGAGQFGRQETLVVADFRSPPGDSTLGATVSEAVRTDLAQSRHLNVMTRAATRELLQLMGRPDMAAVEFDVAREIATREGAKAILDGDVVQLGPSYVVSARLVSSLDGKELAAFRETAQDDGELVAALGRLSHEIRGKVGESLRDIREAQSLERVTTSSLPALRKYVEGSDVIAATGDNERGQALLREALAYDSTFAMAWRRLASTYVGSGRERDQLLEAIKKAYQFRDRLSENERLLTEGSYYSYGPVPDVDRSLVAYETLVARDSTNRAALNNAATRYGRKGEWPKAIAALERATKLPSPFGGAFTNLVDAHLAVGDVAGASRTLEDFRRVLPSNALHWMADTKVLLASGALDSASGVASRAFARATSSGTRDVASYFTGSIAMLRGQPREGLRWYAIGNEAASKDGASRTPLLVSGLDSAFVTAWFLEDRPRARQYLLRALARAPIESLPPAERPWSYLSEIAAVLNDPALSRSALQGHLRDTASVGVTPGREAWLRALLARSEGRHADAIPLIREARRTYYRGPRLINYDLGDAFDLAGAPDSAIVYYERFAERAFSDIDEEPMLLGGTFKRLGELYDAKGDTTRAESYYQRFVDLWKDAEPELQPKVRRARERIAELRRNRG